MIAGYYEEDKSYVVELHKDKIDEILKEIFNANEIKYLWWKVRWLKWDI